MDTLFMNSRNCKTSDPHRLLLNLSDKTDLKISDGYATLCKKLCKKNKFKLSTPTWRDEFEISDGLYSVSDIQDFFDYI